MRFLFPTLAPILGLFLISSVPGAEALKKADNEVEARLKKDLTFLASATCEGRGPTTKGLVKAGDYIAAEFKKMGLKPAFKDGSYFQNFKIGGAEAILTIKNKNGTVLKVQPILDYQPLGTDLATKATGEAAFVGYGITSKEAKYDDYNPFNAKGKVAVILRDTPQANKANKALKAEAALVKKLMVAKKNGAVAVLFVNDAETGKHDDTPMEAYTYSSLRRPPTAQIPALHIKRSVLEKLLPKDKNLADIEKSIDKDLKPASFDLTGWTVSLEIKTHKQLFPLRNVVGVLEGSGPRAKETIIIGAHYDHLGYGSPSSLSRDKRRLIHHGADDNGSGTTAMLELARRYANMKNRKGRRLVFIAFSGEELGLFGSQYYCKNPAFPLAETAAMFNLDMVGRLTADKKTNKPLLKTEGHGTAKPFKDHIEALAKKYDFTLSSQASGMGPSDHASFYEKKVPVLFYWTNSHADYHRPSDTVDRINFAGMCKVLAMSEETVNLFTTMERPKFIAVKGTRPRMSGGPRLGIRPDYNSKDGVEVEGVTPGGPADEAGMKDGDIIVSIAGKETKNLTSYMQAMSTQKRKTTIIVVVLREKKKVSLKVNLD